MEQDRRKFLKMSAMCAGAAFAGCATGAHGGRASLAKGGDCRALLLHLGHNMWCDWYPKEADVSALKDGLPDRKLRCRDDKRTPAFRQLEEAGFDQVPCGTADMGQVVRLGREAASPARLKGFLVAPWAACDSSESLAAIKRGVDRLVAAAWPC